MKNILLLSITLAGLALGQGNAVNGKGGGITNVPAFKTALGLQNVDNTADINKPISTLQAAAIAAAEADANAFSIQRANHTGTQAIGTVTGLQAALDLKAPLASPTFTGTAVLPSTTSIGTVSATELGYLDGVSANLQTLLDLKAPLASPTFTGTVVLPSTTSIGSVSNTEIAALDGIGSNIANQLVLKAPLSSPTFTGTVQLPASTIIGAGADLITSTELSYIKNLTSDAQTQIDAKSPLASPSFTGTVTLPSTTSIGTVSAAELSYVDGVTSALQTQLDAKVALTGNQTIAGDKTFTGSTTTGAITTTTTTQIIAGGNVQCAVNGGAGSGLSVANDAWMVSGGNDILKFWNSTFNGAPFIRMGGDTSSFPALKRSGTALEIRLADDSGYGDLNAGTITSGGSAVVLATGTQTIAGNKTLSGQTELTGQAATNSTSAMTRGLTLDLLGSEDYYIMREDWFNGSDWALISIGSGIFYQGLYDTSVQSKVGLWTGATIDSVAGAALGTGAAINPSAMFPWKFIDITKTGDSIADCRIRIGFHDSGSGDIFTSGAFTGFDYNPASSANWRFYDSDNNTYTDTGVAVVANTSYKFSMRAVTNQQIYWSLNDGAETLRTSARDYITCIASGIKNSVASNKYILKDFTSFVGTPAR